MPLVNSSPVNALLPGVIGNLENLKVTSLEVPLDPSRQTPSDLATYSVAANAFPFIAAQVQEASDLAHNNTQFAAAVNPVLVDLVGLDSSASYAQLQSSYPKAVPTLPAPNPDGSFTINTQDLLAQFQAIISDVATTTDAHLLSIGSQASALSALSAPAIGPRPLNSAFQASAPAAAAPCTAGTATAAGSIVISANDCTANAGKPPDYWQLAKSGVRGLSTLAGFADPQVGKEIATVGGAVIDAGMAIAKIDGIVSAGSIFSSLPNEWIGVSLGGAAASFRSGRGMPYWFGWLPRPESRVMSRCSRRNLRDERTDRR